MYVRVDYRDARHKSGGYRGIRGCGEKGRQRRRAKEEEMVGCKYPLEGVQKREMRGRVTQKKSSPSSVFKSPIYFTYYFFLDLISLRLHSSGV